MSVLEITSLRLEGLIDDFLEAKAQDHSAGALKGDKNVPDTFYIDNIQKTINLQFPWELLDIPKPSVPRDGKMNPATEKALEEMGKVAQEIGNKTAISALNKIRKGDLRQGASELWDSALEIAKTLKTDSKYFEEKGEEADWDYQKKLQYMKQTVYPSYFPKPWQAKNMCSFVGGGDKHGKFVQMPQSPEEFRTCQTPYFNHFLMWGPECPGCGVNGADPRALRLKSLYPEAFTYEKNKKRMENHIWSPVVPSPGFMPYVSAPPEGSPYYADPNDPHPETEGVRFFDSEDEKWYRQYMAKFEEFKNEFGEDAEAYNKMFFDMLPHKRTKSRYAPPNEWSAGVYGRKTPLWPDGTARPPAAELKRLIQERGVGTSTAGINSVVKIAEKFKKKYAIGLGKSYIKQKPDGTLIVSGVQLDRDALNAMNNWDDLVDMGVPRNIVGQIALEYGGPPRNVDVWLENNSTPYDKGQDSTNLRANIQKALDEVYNSDDGGGGVSRGYPMPNDASSVWSFLQEPYSQGALRSIHIVVETKNGQEVSSYVNDDDDAAISIENKLINYPNDFKRSFL